MRHATYETFSLLYNRKLPRNEYGIQKSTSYKDIRCSIGQCKQMCAQLAQELERYTFRVEPIGGGGIEIMNWPGKPADPVSWSPGDPRFPYKSFRFRARGFPWLNDETPDDRSFWLSDHGKLRICLKAFYGAPAFTKHEVETFRRVLLETLTIPEGWRTYKKIPGV